MSDWKPGYTQSEIDSAQERYGIVFPPDFAALLLDRSPARGYDWNTEDPRIREKLAWPLEMLIGSVEVGLWWSGWGEYPAKLEMRRELVREAVKRAPRLIPILSHRFIPEIPHENGNPVFSMFGFDTIFYGANLDEFFENEFGGKYMIFAPKYVPLWSDLAKHPEQVTLKSSKN